MPKKGNILLVANWESNVGYAWWLMENFWITISNHFEKQGRSSYLIYPKITQIPATIKSSHIETYECDFQNRSFKNLRVLHKLIKDNSIKYIYLSDSPPYSLFYVLLRTWGIRKIVVHDHTPGERTPAHSWKKLAKKLINSIPFYTADHFIAVTDFIYKRFIEVNCISENKCSIAANGIAPINTMSIDKDYTYKTFGIPGDKHIVVTTGRASYYKGIDLFIECANELINQQGIRGLHFLFCGDGPDMADFQQLAKDLNVEQHVTFAGKRSDIRSILPSCSIGFHAATGEVGYSLSILEYMSAGLATVVPDRSSTSGATTHLLTGLLYQPGNITSACKAIYQCLDDQLRHDISHNAVKAVEEKYNIKNTNNALISALSNVFK